MMRSPALGCVPTKSVDRVTPVPPPEAAQVFIDFDGTLTQTDVVDQLVVRFAQDDRWKELERLWQLKEIGSRQCLSEEMALVRISDSQLEEFLAEIKMDPGAVDLIEMLRAHRVPVTVLSDGVDFFIEKILGRHGLADLEVRCNTMVRDGDRIGLTFPYEQSECETSAGHCKCVSACARILEGRQSIYIGDGRSDLCAARKAHCIFAKGELARGLKAEKAPFHSYATLGDVRRLLQANWTRDRRTKGRQAKCLR